MPELTTTHFGTVRFRDDEVLIFPAGLPGYWHVTRFLLLPHSNNSSIRYLQSVDLPGLRFILVAALKVMPDYELSIEPWDLKTLSVEEFPPSRDTLKEIEVDSWFVISIPEPDRLTINMLAPVVIARKSRRGIQAVRSDTRYSHAFLLDAAALDVARRPVC